MTMTGPEFSRIQKSLGLSDRELALALDVAERSVRRWKTKGDPPGPVKVLMRLFAKRLAPIISVELSTEEIKQLENRKAGSVQWVPNRIGDK